MDETALMIASQKGTHRNSQVSDWWEGVSWHASEGKYSLLYDLHGKAFNIWREIQVFRQSIHFLYLDLI